MGDLIAHHQALGLEIDLARRAAAARAARREVIGYAPGGR